MTTPPEPEPAPPSAPDTGLDQRVTSLETGQQSILAKLDQLLAGPGDPPAEPEQPPVSIADEIRRQLAARDKQAPKSKPEQPAAKTEPEQPPKAPVRRLTKFLWGADE